MSRTIYFAQTSLDTWKATCGSDKVATIREIEEDAEYRITYYRAPCDNPRNPAKTTRTLRGTLDHAQGRIAKRGW